MKYLKDSSHPIVLILLAMELHIWSLSNVWVCFCNIIASASPRMEKRYGARSLTLLARIVLTLAPDSYANTVAHELYRIHRSCGENISAIAVQLDYLQTILPYAANDAQSKTPSPAYRTFFKDQAYAPFVSHILSQIAAGDTVQLGPGISFPMLICANKPGDFQFIRNGIIVDLYSYSGCADPFTAGVYLESTQFIAICPDFWKFPATPSPSADNCLRVNTAINRFRFNNAQQIAFIFYQVYALMHEIAHFYILATGKCPSGPDAVDQYHVNQCFWLNAFDSSINPENYVYYAESK